MKQSENINELAMALSKAQGQLNGAAKTSDNPFFKSPCQESGKSLPIGIDAD